MKNASKLTVLGLILTTTAAICTPMAASADGLQQTKNTWRNIATGAAVLAGVGIATHNTTDTAIGLIGTLVGASQYEQARHEQSVQQNGYWGNDRGFSDRDKQAIVDANRWNGRDGGRQDYGSDNRNSNNIRQRSDQSNGRGNDQNTAAQNDDQQSTYRVQDR